MVHDNPGLPAPVHGQPCVVCLVLVLGLDHGKTYQGTSLVELGGWEDDLLPLLSIILLLLLSVITAAREQVVPGLEGAEGEGQEVPGLEAGGQELRKVVLGKS